MPQLIRSVFIASLVALSAASTNATSAQSKDSQEIIDARQESQIITTYILSPYLRSSDLQVSVRNGKATLTGKVDESVNKDLAKQIALGVKGIKEVDNQIVVQADYVQADASSERRYGDMIDDASITAAVKAKIAWSKHTDGLNAEVDTVGGQVTLKGTADNADAKTLAGRLASSTRGVVSVKNLLEVKGKSLSLTESAKNSVKEAERDIADSWITTKVKSTLLYSSNVNSANVSVSTNQGIVTLSGKLDSGAEQALVIELAQNVRGVRSVHSKGLNH